MAPPSDTEPSSGEASPGDPRRLAMCMNFFKNVEHVLEEMILQSLEDTTI
jgi:hypothetical protein